jgi:hypothetical protein
MDADKVWQSADCISLLVLIGKIDLQLGPTSFADPFTALVVRLALSPVVPPPFSVPSPPMHTHAAPLPHLSLPVGLPLCGSPPPPPAAWKTFPPPTPTFSPFPPPSPPTLFPPPSSHSPCSGPYPTPRFGPSTGISGVAKVAGCPIPASKAAGMRRSGSS